MPLSQHRPRTPCPRPGHPLLAAVAACAVLWAGAGCGRTGPSQGDSPDPAQSSLAVDRDGIVANGADALGVTVTLRNAEGVPLAGRKVFFTATGSGNLWLPEIAESDAEGVVRTRLTSTRAERKLITAFLNPLTSAAPLQEDPAVRPRVTFVPGPVSAAASRVEVAPPSLPADALATARITVALTDAFGNPVAGKRVVLLVSGTGNDLTQPPPADGQGVTQGSLRSIRAEVKTITARVEPEGEDLLLAAQPTVTFTPGPPERDRSTVAANPAVLVADGVASSQLTVTLLDQFLNPVPGQRVSLELVSPSPRVTLRQPGALTDARGVAVGSVASTLAAPVEIRARVNPGPSEVALSQRARVAFLPGPPSAATSTISAAPRLIVAGAEQSAITVLVRDAFDNPVPGVAVRLVSSGTQNALVQPPPSDAGGAARGAFSSTRAELKTLSAVLLGPIPEPLPRPALVGVLPAPVDPDRSQVTARPATLVADGSAASEVTVALRDRFDNPVPLMVVQLFATGSGNVVAQPPAPTDLSGVARGALASTRAEPKTLTAVVSPGANPVVLTPRPVVTFLPGPPDAAASTVVAAPASVVADGSQRSTVTVTVTDAFGNPLAGQVVQLAASGTGNALAQPPPTDAGGSAAGSLASTRAERKTLTATVNPGPSQVVLAQRPEILFTASLPSGTASSLVAVPAQVPADGRSTSALTVTVRDALMNPVPGATVQLSVTGGSGNVLVQPPPTDARGECTGTLASAVLGARTVSGVINPGPGQTPITQTATVTFVPGPPDPAASSVAASPATAVADGVAFSTVTVVVRDVLGRPLPGQAVALAASGTGHAFAQPPPTDASGTTTGRIASTRAEVKTITATVNPGPSQVVLAQQPQVTFLPGPPSATASTVVARPASVVADGVERSQLTVTVRDAQGNPIPGAAVRLQATGTQNALGQPPGPTDAAGMAVGSLASTLIEVKTVTATVNPGPSQVVLADQPQVTFTAGPPSPTGSTVTAAPLTVEANGVDTSLISVTVRDAAGNPLPGQLVRLGASGTGNLFQQPGATDAAGATTGRIASTRAEVKTVVVTVNPGPTQVVLAQQPRLTFVPGPVSAAASTVVARPTVVPADGVSRSTITVTVLDANANPIPGAAVSLAATGTGSSLLQPLAPTDGAGVAVGSLASSQAELKQVTATVNPGPAQVVLDQRPSVTFQGGTPGDVPGTGCTFGSSVAMDPGTGLPSVAYYQGGHLMFTRCTGDCVLAPRWTTPEIVDPNVFVCSDPVANRQLTLLYLRGGTPAIAYRDQTVPTCAAKYAVRTGTGWSTNVVEDIGQCEVQGSGVVGAISMALLAPGIPAVAYHSHLFGVLGQRFAACVAGCDQGGAALLWNRQNVDAIGTNVGHFSSVRTDPVSGRPRIAYQDDISSVNAVLKYATCSDASPLATCLNGQGNWSVGIADQVFGVRLGEWASLDFRPDGTPLIAHQDVVNATLRLSTCLSNCGDGATSTWRRERIDDGTGPFTGYFTFLRVDPLGRARIAYYSAFNSALRYAVQSTAGGSAFTFHTVDAPVSFGQSSFVLAPPGTLFSYANSQGLRFYPAGY